MALPRNEVVPGTIERLERFDAFVRSLGAEDWAKPTRCEGWTVADVAAHVVGDLSLVATGRASEVVDPAHTDREVAARRGRMPDEIADELREAAKPIADLLNLLDDAAWDGPPPVDFGATLGHAIEAIWYDLYVHTQDINEAIGRPPERSDPGVRAAVSYVVEVLEERGWNPTTVALDGLEEFTINGGGQRITGDPYDFVMVVTGRADPAILGLDDSINIYRPADS